MQPRQRNTLLLRPTGTHILGGTRACSVSEDLPQEMLWVISCQRSLSLEMLLLWFLCTMPRTLQPLEFVKSLFSIGRKTPPLEVEVRLG